ncbi:hypothetical protein ASF49_03925 [Methylobacterium sp. Leaf104]|uniref:hypothetical protein n=1 Tax=Methylobacterium TaxID=407 RepID=UPI0006FA36F6|nr:MULTISPECIES: hypothetical protein [Methylobacterium]KQP38179.1 hypothetical protein ASF49_03925 [Methylobacterium sp. Leaf104]MCI9880445.1 hypothetical protein [Methylobacterium goesingense]
MDLSLIGIVVAAILLCVSAFLGPPLIVATIASFAFGATAIGSLPALGGSSPLIYIVPGCMLIAALAVRRGTIPKLGIVLMRDQTTWAVLLLAVYAAAGAVILPRLFEGATTSFVTSRLVGVFESSLAPGPGNISQTAYFLFGALIFAAFSILLLQPQAIRPVARGFFLWAALTATFGVIDRVGKLIGAGDVLEPIRTASYAMLTGADLTLGNVTRISGAFSEASAFGGAALASFGFSFAYWRRTGSSRALGLAIVLLILVLLSTSTTAYAGFAFLASVQIAMLARTAVTNRLIRSDLVVLMALAIGGALVLLLYLTTPGVFDPVYELFRVTILEKDESQSGIERSYWNSRSLDSFVDTFGFGIGMGSSRASSWVIAILSQLGFVGTALMAAIVVSLLRPCPPTPSDPSMQWIAGLHDGARLAALTQLFTATISGGQADPGSQFFIALATVLACRAHLRAKLHLRNEMIAAEPPDLSRYAGAFTYATRS